MEYSKDIVLGVKFFNGEDKHENLKVEGLRENKYDKANKIVKKISKAKINNEKSHKPEINKRKVNNKNKVIKFMNEHKFITSISITCFSLIILDCVLVYSFVELLQRL